MDVLAVPSEVARFLEPHFRKQRRVSIGIMVFALIGVALAGAAGYASYTKERTGHVVVPPGICAQGDAACRDAYGERLAANDRKNALQWMGFFMAGSLLLGGWGLFGWVRHRDATRSAIYEALGRPDEVAWVYMIRRPSGSAVGMHVGLVSGKVLEVGLLPQDMKSAEAALRRHLPRATHGFDKGKAERFTKDPASLRR